MTAPEDYMLPCLSKQILGFDCMGCGLQRSAVLLFKGEFTAAFTMYPAIYTLVLFVLFLMTSIFIKFKHSERIKIALVIVNISIIVISYIIKLIN